MIASSIYYDQNHFKKVYDYKYTPKKNEINFAYANSNTKTCNEISPKINEKFIGTEYVIWEYEQICPILGATLKRDEYCVIWRDNNFSTESVYNNSFDELFKNFLKERLNYTKKIAKYNIYNFIDSKEALEIINRKKYGKIILISNIGSDKSGKLFIDQARKILQNDIVVLFLAYNIAHLEWVKDYKNALFSNKQEYFEKYIESFIEGNIEKTKENIIELKNELEENYKIKFNFDNNFLEYPLLKTEGKYSDLEF